MFGLKLAQPVSEKRQSAEMAWVAETSRAHLHTALAENRLLKGAV